jgi:chorismate mutase/prephenate dehydratase
VDLIKLRETIDEIDSKLIELFRRRMDTSVEIARYKQANGIPIYDPVREREVLDKLSDKVEEGRKLAVTELYTLLFTLSHAEQEKIHTEVR